MREVIIEILNGINAEVDFYNCTGIISDKMIDSIEFLDLITALEERFGIEIPSDKITAQNFDSVDSIVDVIAGEDND